MATLVLTAIGDDHLGLVDALSGVIADHGGNWEKSHMAHLGGKFAGIVMVSVPDDRAEGLIANLAPLETQGLLDITAELSPPSTASQGGSRLSVDLVGLDHPGIVHDISHALAVRGVSIEELESETSSAPMGGGNLFRARLIVELPTRVSVQEATEVLEDLAHHLMVDLEVHETD